MKTGNERLADAASRMASKKGIVLNSLEFSTPDGRSWSLVAVAGGGFRLFEINRGGHREEHDSTEGDTWELGDALEYLGAIGAAKPGVRR